jgi:hypothetical protein
MTMQITVTADDIARGTPCSAGRCPISRAVRRSLPDYSGAIVGHDNVIVWQGVVYSRIPLPPAAQRFVKAFDQREPVEPFSFAVEI